MTTQVIDIRKEAIAASDEIVLGFGKGILKAIEIGSDAHCSALAYLRSSKGKAQDCALIKWQQVAPRSPPTWHGDIKVHRPLVLRADFYGLTVGDIIELKAIVEV